jgi:guanylate kinase
VDGVDYHFRSREQLENLKAKDHFVVMDVRGDLQALDLQELSASLAKEDVFFEGNPFVGRALQTSPALAEVNRLSVFMSPLSRDEILFLKAAEPSVSLPDLIADVMRRKLLRRTRRQKGELSLRDLENIEKRASSAYRELQEAHYFQYVISLRGMCPKCVHRDPMTASTQPLGERAGRNRQDTGTCDAGS